MTIMDKKKSSEETIKIFERHAFDKELAEVAMEFALNGSKENNQNKNKETSAKEDTRQEKLLALKMAKEKDIIDVKDFELLYGYSKEAQKGFRSRANNPLPSIPKPFGSKIQYRKIDVEDWLSNQK